VCALALGGQTSDDVLKGIEPNMDVSGGQVREGGWREGLAGVEAKGGEVPYSRLSW
jgi:hypothetical protein